ncbi:MAG TPA: hypothetical protein PJ986_11040 [Gammaproteobacteria bacterium]|nr:hypothetical protein [Gammaproteobacteria bacterium]
MPTARALHRLSSALLCAFLARAAFAANIEYADFRYADHRYRYRYVAHVLAPVAAVRRVMTDYERLSRVNGDIVVSRVLARFGERQLKRQILLKHCVLLFCFDLDLVEHLETRDDGTIVATIAPDEGNIHQGHTEMKIEGLPDGSTRITATAEQEPAFFIPPLLGPLLMKRSFLRETAETARRIEALAREEPVP